MIKRIENDKKVGNAHIKILYPGSVIENSTDSGLGSIGRIDHANIGGNVTIKMHPHINDDILSYFRTGHAVHTDSEGETDSIDSWRLLASPTEQTQLQFSSETWIYDTRLTTGKTIELPDSPKNELTGLLYVFQGNILLNNDINLLKGESVLFKNEQIDINAIETSELVLFITDENSEYYDGGMYSGNKH
jgi:redox-sensitive bicupin YhaK (pirin superfamily)